MENPTDGDDGPSGPDAARAYRQSLVPEEHAVAERRVSELLDLLERAHAMAVLREFAFAEGSLRLFGHVHRWADEYDLAPVEDA